MELIDRHDLILEILEHDICDDKTIDKIILDAPVVEAIPIEWLKEYATNFENKIAEERLHLGISRAKGLYWRDENGEWVGIDFKNPITEMLENWGEENETNDAD